MRHSRPPPSLSLPRKGGGNPQTMTEQAGVVRRGDEREGSDEGRFLAGAPAYYPSFTPPNLQMLFHSAGVIGCTERREYFTSAMSLNFVSALICASVTGFGSGSSALMSTATNTPFGSVGSL